MALFVDRTGRPGPSTWEGGAPPPDADDLPVGGVSWYEARAYARFARKELPTVLEWNAAAIPEAARWVVPHGRYDATGPVRGGDSAWRESARRVRHGGQRARVDGERARAGQPVHPRRRLERSDRTSSPSSTRSRSSIARRSTAFDSCAGWERRHDLARASAPIPGLTRDFATVRPVDDATFRGLLRALRLRPHAARTRRSSRATRAPPDWVREDVEFDVPGDSLRMQARASSCRSASTPPYQTVVLWPASDALLLRDHRTLSMSYADYFVRSGRALVYPIYEHTYGRGRRIDDDDARRHDRASRPDAPLGARDAPLDRLRGDAPGRRHDALRVRRHELGRPHRRRRCSPSSHAFGWPCSTSPVSRCCRCDRRKIPSTSCRAFTFRCSMLSGKYDSVFPYELSQKPVLPAARHAAGRRSGTWSSRADISCRGR